MVPLILQLGNRWRWVASYLNRPLYSWGKNPRYPVDERISRLHSRSGGCGNVIFYTFRDSNIHSSVVQSVAYIAWMCSLLDTSNETNRVYAHVPCFGIDKLLLYPWGRKDRHIKKTSNHTTLRRWLSRTLTRFPPQILSPNGILCPVFFII
jgi:hypothetical protein